MKQEPTRSGRFFMLVLTGILFSGQLMAIEEPEYRLIQSDGIVEVRDYDSIVVAESVVDADFQKAGNKAFRNLFNYISDNNIKMTAPVTQESVGNDWAVRFVMPKEFTIDSLPEPQSANVTMKVLPPRRVAVVRYSGSWSSDNYREHLSELTRWVEAEGYAITGDAVWARYNGPFSLWFMRRNEIHLPVQTT
jgi:effector-binding domain-containing protein